MRLGEILNAAGLVTKEALAEALSRQQAKPGARIGTHFVQMGLLSPDQVALALAKQKSVPPALVRHFVHHDPQVAALIGPKVATEHSLLPIAYSRAGGRRLVICFRDPNQPTLVRRLEQALGMPVTPCVASELAISVYLDHYYGVSAVYNTAPTRAESEDGIDVDLDFDDESTPVPGRFELVELDHTGVERGQPEAFIPEVERKSAIRKALAAAQASDAGIDALDLVAASAPVPATSPRLTPAPTDLDTEWCELPEILGAIESADERNQVGDSIMRFLQQRFAAGMMFTVKDGLAMGHRGFGGHLDDKDTVTALMLPLQKNILGAAHDARTLWRGDPTTLTSAAQERFLKLFDLGRAPSDVVVAPVSVGARVVCLIYAHAHQGIELDDPDVDELTQIAGATERAFARLIKKSRAQTASLK